MWHLGLKMFLKQTQKTQVSYDKDSTKKEDSSKYNLNTLNPIALNYAGTFACSHKFRGIHP